MTSPKFEFMKDERRAGQWQDLVADALFQDAVAKAFQQYSLQVSQEDAPANNLAVAGLRLQGARQVLEILTNLGKHARLPLQQDHIKNLEPV